MLRTLAMVIYKLLGRVCNQLGKSFHLFQRYNAYSVAVTWNHGNFIQHYFQFSFFIGDTACDQEVAKIVSGIEDVVTDDSVSAKAIVFHHNTGEAEKPVFIFFHTDTTKTFFLKATRNYKVMSESMWRCKKYDAIERMTSEKV